MKPGQFIKFPKILVNEEVLGWQYGIIYSVDDRFVNAFILFRDGPLRTSEPVSYEIGGIELENSSVIPREEYEKMIREHYAEKVVES
jgi:hypothetical protein